MPRTVQEIAKRATDHTLVDYMYHGNGLQVKRNMGKPSMNKLNGHVSRPSHLR